MPAEYRVSLELAIESLSNVKKSLACEYSSC